MDINSTNNGAVVNGSDSSDNIKLYGNHSTVNALGGDDIISVNGGRHDNGVWIVGDESDRINAGNGNDSISIYSRGVTVYGEAGNDTVTINRDYTFADGGDGNDIFHMFGGGSNPINNITITSGAGNDTIQIEPRYNKNVGVVVTDFSNDDTFRLDDITFGISDRSLTQTNVNGNVVIQDTSENQPLNMTLQGVSDISQVANARYIRYYEGTPYGSSTFGELFGVTSSGGGSSSPSNTSTDTNSGGNSNQTTSSGGGDTVINNYYGDVYIINNYGGIYIYNGGNKVINNYQQGEVVQLDSDYQGIGLEGNSFFVKSSSGQVEIQNSRDKFIGYGAGNSNVVAYSYVASGGGEVNGRDKGAAEIMIGGDNANNQILAGDGGSSMWGGAGGADSMTGGAGYDEFFWAIGSGDDTVNSAGQNDMINLLGVTLEQIADVRVNESGVDLSFKDGGKLRVEGNTGVGYKLGNEVYACNQSTGEWYTKNNA